MRKLLLFALMTAMYAQSPGVGVGPTFKRNVGARSSNGVCTWDQIAGQWDSIAGTWDSWTGCSQPTQWDDISGEWDSIAGEWDQWTQ